MVQLNRLIVATCNRDKLREINAILNDLDLEIVSINEYPNLPEVDETGLTLEENAIKKAKEINAVIGIPALADDTGLEVDALNGNPGVYSSRYSGENATYADNVKKLLSEMVNVPDEKRGAQFRTVIALVNGNKIFTAEGIQTGKILFETKGNNGFGYDPVFFVPEYKQTFAEMSLSLKNKISHRGKALTKMKEILKNHFHEVFYEIK